MRGILIAKWFERHKIPFIPTIVQKAYCVICSCDISRKADIHPSVTLGHHGLGVVIHNRASIGEDTKISQSVTIGLRPPQEGVPQIGKNCRIYTGACIIGNVVIGDNVKIGANAVVLCDVPDNCTAVGVPAKVLPPPGIIWNFRVVYINNLPNKAFIPLAYNVFKMFEYEKIFAYSSVWFTFV